MISVVVCTHEPRADYLQRTLESLDRQTLPKDRWELLVVDNASATPVAARCDLSWHPRSRHLREETLGLTRARISGIRNTAGDLIVFVDDDNVLAADYLEQAAAIQQAHADLGVFGAGVLAPEFEVPPKAVVRRHLRLLALRTASTIRMSRDADEREAIPWGAGLCVRRSIADAYVPFIEAMPTAHLLDRRGEFLFAGGDDLFSRIAAARGWRFGIFAELRITHLIAAKRVKAAYMIRLIHDHAFSHRLLDFVERGVRPHRLDAMRLVRLAVHGIVRGPYSMRCRWAAISGEGQAARLIVEQGIVPLDPAAIR